MNPTSIRCAANPASTRGPLSNSTKLTLYGTPASAPDACSRVSRSCCWSPRFRTVPVDLAAAAAADVVAVEPVVLLAAHAETTASRLASDTAPSIREMVCDIRTGFPLRGRCAALAGRRARNAGPAVTATAGSGNLYALAGEERVDTAWLCGGER